MAVRERFPRCATPRLYRLTPRSLGATCHAFRLRSRGDIHPPIAATTPAAGRRSAAARSGSSFKTRLIIAAIIAIFALVSYYGKPGDENQITGEKERVAFSDEADEVADRPAGRAGDGPDARRAVARSRGPGDGLTHRRASCSTAWTSNSPSRGATESLSRRLPFTLLADPKTVNAFALPGGQVFITAALFRDLETEGQLAGVLGHEIGHVIERHGNKRMAQHQLFQGLAAAGGVAGGDQQSAQWPRPSRRWCK